MNIIHVSQIQYTKRVLNRFTFYKQQCTIHIQHTRTGVYMQRIGEVKMVWYGNLTGIIVKDGVNPSPRVTQLHQLSSSLSSTSTTCGMCEVQPLIHTPIFPPSGNQLSCDHRVVRVLSFFPSRRNWDSPNPSPARRVCPPPVLGGEAHSLAREGLGES